MGVIKEGDLQLVPISMIRPSKLNTYDLEDPNDFLLSTIELAELNSTFTVIGPMEDGCYELMSGERRYHACIKLNKANPDNPPYDMVPILIKGDKNTSVTDQKIKIDVCNLTSRIFSPTSLKEHNLDLFHALEDKKKEGSLSGSVVKKFAETLGITERAAQLYQSVVKTDEEINGFEDIVKSENIPLHEASKIASKLHSLSDEEKKKLNTSSSETKQKLDKTNSEEKRKEILRDSVLGTKISGELQSLREEMKKKKKEKKDIPDPNIENFQQTVSNRLEGNDTSSGNSQPTSEIHKNYPNAVEELFDSHGIRSEYKDLNVNKSDSNDLFYKKMIEWSQKMLEKDELSEKEQEVVDSFRRLVDKF